MKKIFWAFWCCVLCACAPEILPVDNPENVELVPVSIDFAAETDFMTKGHARDGASNSTDIKDLVKNMWVIQFDGTTDNAHVIGNPQYISDFANFSGPIELAKTNGEVIVCFLANTFEGVGYAPITKWSTLADLRNWHRLVSKQSDIVGAIIEGKEYFVLSGEIRATITGGLDLNVPLHRNIAKATFTIDNKVKGLTINSTQVCSVPSVSYYASGRTIEHGQFPLASAFDRVNYDAQGWDAPEGSTACKPYSVYLPINLRGTSQSTNSKDKAKYAPYAATYLLVNAVLNDTPVTMKFYLGGNDPDKGQNFHNDYNIEGGFHYKYTFTINSADDFSADSRVEIWDMVDFTDISKYAPANSYILNPAPAGTGMRRFRIPVDHQITTFWGNNGYENNSEFLLTSTWDCKVLAADFEVNDSNFNISKGTDTAGNKYFEVEVADGVEGNVIVAVGPGGDKISWSWHLWITDYDPYSCLQFGDGVAGQYVYPVTGGSVHRYADHPDPNKLQQFPSGYKYWLDAEKVKYWSKPENSKQYIMDRYLGALSADRYPYDHRGMVYYQYGRKDPFFYGDDVYKYYTTLSKFEKFHSIPDASGNKGDGVQDAERKAVKYSVNNPTTYIVFDKKAQNTDGETSYSWTMEPKYTGVYSGTSKQYVYWNDPNSTSTKKSLFDPCPSGFSLPLSDVYAGFVAQGFYYEEGLENLMYDYPTVNYYQTYSGTLDANTPYSRGFKSQHDALGLRYWPIEKDADGNVKDVPEDTYINFHAYGIKLYSSNNAGSIQGGIGGAHNAGAVWFYDHLNYKNLNVHSFQFGNTFYYKNSNARANGNPVRCITVNR